MSALGRSHFESSESSSLRFVRKMNGSAQSVLVKDKDNQLWVLKPRSGLQGPNALANEFLGAKLCKALGLPVPDSKLIQLTEEFSETESWLETASGSSPIEPGPHFVSRYVPDATGVDAYEIIPPTLRSALQDQTQYLGMLIFDTWAMHADQRQALFTMKGSKLAPTFFDNSHLFGGPHWRGTNTHVYPSLLHKVAFQQHLDTQESEIWVARMEEVIPSVLEHAVAQTPSEWFVGDIQILVAQLIDRLQSLRSLATSTLAEVECCLRNARDLDSVHAGFDFRILSHGGTARWA